MSYVDKPVAEREDARRFNRHTVLIGVKLRRPGETWFTSRVTDLTESGFRLQSFMNLSPGMTIWVMFSGFEGRRATVTWVRAHEAGCTFDTPLHTAIFDHIVRMGR